MFLHKPDCIKALYNHSVQLAASQFFQMLCVKVRGILPENSREHIVHIFSCLMNPCDILFQLFPQVVFMITGLIQINILHQPTLQKWWQLTASLYQHRKLFSG